MTAEKPLTVHEAGERLGITTREVLELIDTGQLPRVEGSGGRWMVPAVAVEMRCSRHSSQAGGDDPFPRSP